MAKTNRHHVTPLSAGGRDKSCNILVLSVEDHRLVHDTLDVPYNTIRKYRKVMNESMFTPTERMALAQAKIESMFYARLKFLPNRLQKKIKDKVDEDTRDLYRTYQLPFGDAPSGTLLEIFEKLLQKRKALYIHLVGGQPLI